MKTVTFCGHSSLSTDADAFLKEKLPAVLEELIAQGATEFLLGGYGSFDRLCAYTVRNLKKKYPHITSVLVVPYMDRKCPKEIYDCSEYPPIENVPKRFAILKRNEYMVKRADIVIAYVIFSFGGAVKTLEYAQRKKKMIINLAEQTLRKKGKL